MSSAMKLKANSGGSVTLVVNDALATDEGYSLYDNTQNGILLSGQALTDVNIIGSNPVATLWPDGSITGSSDNGSFTKYANGELECRYDNGVVDTTALAFGSVFYSESAVPAFPILFIAIPEVAFAGKQTGGICWGSISDISVSICDCQIVGGSNTSASTSGYIAKGRWKV